MIPRVLDARHAVGRDFDVVYTSIGTITWLQNLDRWAEQVFALLRPGGTFYIRDGHPALYALDENAPDLTTRYPYFGDGRAQQWDDASPTSGTARWRTRAPTSGRAPCPRSWARF